MGFLSKATQAASRKSPLLALMTVVAMGLASCGFEPVYGENSATPGALSQASLRDPTTQPEFLFLKAFEERLPPPQNPQYRVDYQLSVSYQGLDVIDASRVQVVGRVVADFVNLETDTVAFVSAVDAFASYTSGGSFPETERRDAESRLMRILADRLITRLMAQTMTLE
ncbi:hypothetical protein KUD11_06815 [Roseovarius sp. LXJ103]|uniref:hypothetical protein n=1 Tax=Roseovarius carneus TaxID=2853164 RepID=UPI000D61D461|nr:hypothetical protein [Roseovarius carneus]MBZ8118357.1 hypothetical protein [Roseovarius carneus]PWE35931.1 hypothetical protein DD563_08150 [Pelagicola sp. LXJ1103]